jgi:hypothetical protein
MAARKLGQSELADSELADSQKTSQKTLEPNLLVSQRPSQGYWQDCVIARILLKEAEEMGN